MKVVKWTNPDDLVIKSSRVVDWDHPSAPTFPGNCDVVIIGGGAMGSSVAYWVKKQAGMDLKVVVIEKDPLVKTFCFFK